MPIVLLAGRAQPGAETLLFLFADHTLDTDRRELLRGSEPVAVEPQVFDLVIYLLANRDRVVSKDDLIAAVWGGRVVSDSTLSSRINAARKAVGDNGAQQRLIRTIARKGIRFVGAVRTQSSGAAAPPPDVIALSLPDRPAIAVLPFINMSGDPYQEYFADGLTEDIITGLSRQHWFFVIARNSTFTYKGRSVDVREVAAQLGVRYILKGSVRKAANRVRVTSQLIDVTNSSHLWAEKYDRELTDIFALQDDITNRVIGSVGPFLTEAARVQRKAPQSVDAWDLVMRAVPHMWRMNTQEHAQAQELLQQAIALDANYAHAHALLGWTYVTMFNLDTSRPIGEFTDKALAAGARAVALDDEEPWAHLVVGLGHARRRRPELAL